MHLSTNRKPSVRPSETCAIGRLLKSEGIVSGGSYGVPAVGLGFLVNMVQYQFRRLKASSKSSCYYTGGFPVKALRSFRSERRKHIPYRVIQ